MDALWERGRRRGGGSMVPRGGLCLRKQLGLVALFGEAARHGDFPSNAFSFRWFTSDLRARIMAKAHENLKKMGFLLKTF